MHAFAGALVASIGGANPSPDPRVLFILRRGSTRVIANEVEMRAVLAQGQSPLAARIHFVVPEELSLLEQVRVAASSHVLAAVHGHALFLGAFLPAQSGHHCSVLEIIGKSWNSGMFSRNEYRSLTVDVREIQTSGPPRR